MAFGSANSCLDLERAVDVAKLYEAVLRRRVRPALFKPGIETWRLDRTCGACFQRSFTSNREAVAHGVSPGHLAGSHRMGLTPHANAVAKVVLEALSGAFFHDENQGIDHLEPVISESGGLLRIWEAGVSPQSLTAPAEIAAHIGLPLPYRFYVGMILQETDPDFVGAVLRQVPDPDVAVWLTTLPPDMWRPDDCIRWLRSGLAKDAVARMLALGASTEHIEVLTFVYGFNRQEAGQAVAAWANVECEPTAAMLAAIKKSGLLQRPVPSAAALDELRQRAEELDIEMSRTELGILLQLTGTTPQVLALLQAGVRSYRELMESPNLLWRTR